MATKRPASDAAGVAPPAKKLGLALSPGLDIGPAAGEEDLEMKVLEVQNKMLSERLRERNRHGEQLENRVEQMQCIHQEYMKLQVGLKQQFSVLRDHLLVAMAPLGGEECVMSVQQVESVHVVDGGGGGGGGLDAIMQSLQQCLQKLSKPRQGDEVVSGEASSRSMVLLEEIAGRHKEGRETRQLLESIALLETRCEQLQDDLANTRFSLELSQSRGDRLETRLEATLLDLHARPALQPQPSEEGLAQSADDGQEGSMANTTSPPEGGGATVDKNDEVETLQGDLQDAKEVASLRRDELMRVSAQLVEARKALDKLQLEHLQLPEQAVKESAVYKSLQAQFSIAALEAAQLRTCLDEAKSLLVSARQQHFSQLEEIRAEEVKYQMEVRDEMALLENALAAVKRDYEVLRIEFERMVASNEQAGPIAKELRVSVESLQKTISQHKSEVNRYKVRAHKAEQQLAKEDKEKTSSASKEVISDPPKVDPAVDLNVSKVEEEERELDKVKAQLKAVELELNSYKEASSGEACRDKAEVIAAEKKARGQVEELKKRFEDYRRDYEKRKEHIREEASRRTKSLTEDNRHMQKDLSGKKHEAQALVAEMECTTQAFEEMQEQNLRLLQQLKEKDDANYKLMSERIKSNSMYKLLLEEKELFHGQLNGMLTEKQRHAEFVALLEERERSTEATIQGLDRELNLQQQANESHRKRTEESLQQLAQLQFQMDDRQRLTESVQESLSGRTDECDRETQLHRKSVEEVASLKRKLEKYKSREWMAAGDEVLLEEIKMYKAKLNCPCCSARKKDTVLTKCFHVFCSECIKNRYDSRLRKCPKCGAAFGANDFHKIYLS